MEFIWTWIYVLSLIVEGKIIDFDALSMEQQKEFFDKLIFVHPALVYAVGISIVIMLGFMLFNKLKARIKW